MADSDIIKHTDIAEPGFVRDYSLKELKEMGEYFPVLEGELEKFAKTLEKTLKGFKIDGATVSDIKKINAAIKDANDVNLIAEKIAKSKIQLTEKQLAQAAIDKQNKKDEIALLKAEIIEMDKTVGTLQRVEAANTRLRIERKTLNTETETGRLRLQAINQEIDKNNKYIIENSDKLKQQKLNVGNYTESIEKAFINTGLFGRSIETLTKIYDGLSEIIGIYKAKQEAAKAATAAAAAATDADTVSKQANVLATEEEVIAKKTDIVATETDTVTTEANTVANKANSLSKLGVAGAIIIAVAALVELGVAYKKSTQEGKDDFEIGEDIAKMALRQAGTVAKHASEIFNLMKAEKALHDERTKNAPEIQRLETLAAVLRAEAQDDFIINEKTGKQEINTTANKIRLLNEYMEALEQVRDIKKEEAQKDFNNAQALADIFKGTSYEREFADKASAAKVALEAVEADFANSTKRARKQRATIERKDFEDRLKLLQDDQKLEIEQIDTFNEDKETQLRNQLLKDIKLNNLNTKQTIENKRREQEQLGAIDSKGISHAKEFAKELADIKKAGTAENYKLAEKTNAEIEKLRDEEFKKESERKKKISEENAKQAEKDFRTTTAQLAEMQSEELLKIEQDYAKKKDFSIKAEEEKQKAILAVKLKYLELEKKRNEDNPEELAKIQKQINELKIAFIQEGVKDEIALGKERLKELKKIEDQITSGVLAGLQRRAELRQEADQREIDFQRRMVDVQAKLAAAGKQNILAQVEAKTDQAEEKKLQDSKRAAKQQENISLIKTFSDVLNAELEKEPRGNFLKAFGKAIAAVGASSAVFAKLFAGNFATGIENFKGNGTGTSDSNVIGFSDGESVVTAKGTEETPGLVTAINKSGLKGAKGWFESIFKPQFHASSVSTTQVKESIHDEKMTKIIVGEFRELKKSIDNKPVPRFDVNKLGDIIESVEAGAVELITTHIRRRGRSSIRQYGG